MPETAEARSRLGEVAARNGGAAVLAALCLAIAVGGGLRLHYAIEGSSLGSPDAERYAEIAASLYEKGRWPRRGELPAVHPRQIFPSDYAPGPPLFAAAVYNVTGGVHLSLARIAIALLGALTALLSFLIARRLAGPRAALTAAVVVALHPALVQYNGALLSEPLAACALAGSILALLWAIQGPSAWAWLAPGALLGITALFRPEYLLVALLIAVVCLVLLSSRGGLRSAAPPTAALLAAFALVLAPWTVRNLVVLDRVVPVSTGGGKALFIGTYLPGDGTDSGVERALHDRFHPGQRYDPARASFSRLLDRVAAERPGRSRDSSLAAAGRHDLAHYVTARPLDYAAMSARKVARAWGPTHPMRPPVWRILHLILVALALAGLARLAWQRRWEALVLGAPLLGITAVGAILIAAPRRTLVLVPLLAALAAVAIDWLLQRVARGDAGPETA